MVILFAAIMLLLLFLNELMNRSTLARALIGGGLIFLALFGL
jgi:hypothetical protein